MMGLELIERSADRLLLGVDSRTKRLGIAFQPLEIGVQSAPLRGQVVEPAVGRTVETRQVSGGKLAPEVILAAAHENCFRCHGMSPEKPPAMNQCAGCHQLGGSKSPQIQGTVPRFHHADHIYDIRPKRKADYAKKVDLCVECHSNVAVTASLKEIRVPESTFCTQCHNGRFGIPEPLSNEVLNKLAALTLFHKETLLARNGR